MNFVLIINSFNSDRHFRFLSQTSDLSRILKTFHPLMLLIWKLSWLMKTVNICERQTCSNNWDFAYLMPGFSINSFRRMGVFIRHIVVILYFELHFVNPIGKYVHRQIFVIYTYSQGCYIMFEHNEFNMCCYYSGLNKACYSLYVKEHMTLARLCLFHTW